MDDTVSWCKTGLQELNSLAQDRRWKLITTQAMDTNGCWSLGSRRRRRSSYCALPTVRDTKIVRSVCLTVCLCPFYAPSSTTEHFRPWLLQNTNRKPPAGSLTHWSAAISDRKDSEAVAGATSEAFARYLHHQQGRVELPSGAYRFAARYLVIPRLQVASMTL